MTSPRLLFAILLACLLLIAGCGPAAPEQTGASEIAAPVAPVVAVAEATATQPPTVEPPAQAETPEPASMAAEPTTTAQSVAEPAPTATPEPEPDWTQTVALVDGLYVRGNPNAPIRLIDYSDFF